MSKLHLITSRLASKIRLNNALAVAPRSSPPLPHDLILYEYEASPWCRLVREYLTILDLDADIRPCPRQTLFLEGAFDSSSRFRPEAMKYFKDATRSDDLTFPLLVDQTNKNDDPVMVCQSYEILQHLWDQYGQSVLPTRRHRPDQRVNAAAIPFPVKFLSLAAPSYLRPFPTSGLLQTKSTTAIMDETLRLYQAEGCHESRLVREVLCTLELPYKSISAGKGTFIRLPTDHDTPPILVVAENSTTTTTLQGAEACMQYLWDRYRDPESSALPSWFNSIPTQNIGRSGSFSVGAYTAFLKGSRALVPPRALD